MRALTLHQPWASLIREGIKTIETRAWSTSYRGPLAIHAGLRWAPGIVGGHLIRSSNLDGSPELWRPGDHDGIEGFQHRCHQMVFCPLGEVIATCVLADVVPITDDLDIAQEYDFTRSYVLDCPDLIGAGAPHLQLHLLEPSAVRPPPATAMVSHSIEDQRDFGDFTPGRYAWLLEEIITITPRPARGLPGLWNWDPEN